MAGLITLITDFGTRDHYVAAMKGVIWSTYAEARIVDLTHEIPPHHIHEAAYFLFCVFPWFPKGTVHVVVVDPGVGTARRALVASLNGQFVVCPDNGILTFLFRKFGLEEIRCIENARFTRPTVCKTFHGRDLFAPVAAHISKENKVPSDIGSLVTAPVCFEFPEPEFISSDTLLCTVIHIDRFGNIITNLPEELIAGRVVRKVLFGDTIIDKLGQTYADVPEGESLALAGSSGFIEIAVNAGDAAKRLGVKVGDSVKVCFSQPHQKPKVT
ncbi:MAG TPA: SAM-dependent chlorinase/fluorinase [Candidatus Hydrogenedentes bacterium]|nr:SAM-dependent chlorinase/fluorinase [Candidatus Hydrogenedentota bacterium]HOL75440.1 SAM-dependent chlorinase/fluorinase [Candidatus Hydrogenedentota bacterium]HPO84949.1 SAM-dependent chlorinase/fluorinase [Candidatus Hydrogenedentota bacterium]